MSNETAYLVGTLIPGLLLGFLAMWFLTGQRAIRRLIGWFIIVVAVLATFGMMMEGDSAISGFEFPVTFFLGASRLHEMSLARG